jgi:hypothetical protein
MVLTEYDLDTKIVAWPCNLNDRRLHCKVSTIATREQHRRQEGIPTRSKCMRANVEKVHYPHSVMYCWRKHNLSAAAHVDQSTEASCYCVSWDYLPDRHIIGETLVSPLYLPKYIAALPLVDDFWSKQGKPVVICDHRRCGWVVLVANGLEAFSHSHGKVEVQFSILKLKANLLDKEIELRSGPAKICSERPQAQRFEKVTNHTNRVSANSSLCGI